MPLLERAATELVTRTEDDDARLRSCGSPGPRSPGPPETSGVAGGGNLTAVFAPLSPRPSPSGQGAGQRAAHAPCVRLGCCCGNNYLGPHPDPGSGAVLRAVSGSSLPPPPLPGTCAFGPPAGEFTPQSRLRGNGCRLFLQRQAPPGLKLDLSSLCTAVGGKQAPHGGFKFFPAAEDALSLFL